jgi:uncharacterized membrane protein
MALSAQVVLNNTTYTAGGSPPVANIIVANAQAAAVAVTGVQLLIQVQGAPSPQPVPLATPVVAVGPGQTTVVPAAVGGISGVIVLGPFPIAMGSAANNNPAQSIPPGVLPWNQQPSQPTPVTYILGANVFGSDLSTTSAGTVGFIVQGSSQPPFGNFGGSLAFNNPYSLINGIVLGVI